jgi:hypothetical protein
MLTEYGHDDDGVITDVISANYQTWIIPLEGNFLGLILLPSEYANRKKWKRK